MKSQKKILKRNLKNSGQVIARTRKFLKRYNKTKIQKGGVKSVKSIKYFTRTNHYVAIENPIIQKPNKPNFLYISHRPIDCLVYLQYLISKKKIEIYKKKKDISTKDKPLSETKIEYYLSFRDTPSLIVEESPTPKYTQFTSSEFITVCQKSLEDNFSQKILEKYERIVKDGLQKKKSSLNLSQNLPMTNTNNSTVLLNSFPSFQNQNDTKLSLEKKLELLKNFYLENLKKNLFILQVIHKKKSLEKKLELLRNFYLENLKRHKFILQVIHKKKDGTEHEVSIVQNIQYVNDLIAKLEKMDSTSQPTVNIQQSTDECDYSNEYNEYEFIEELETEFGTVKIVGCLDYKKMAPYLKNEELLKYFKKFMCNEPFEQDFISFYDSFLKDFKAENYSKSSVENVFTKQGYFGILNHLMEFMQHLLKYLKDKGKLKEGLTYEQALADFTLFFQEKIKIISKDFLKKLDVKSISYIWHCFLKKIRRTSDGSKEIYYEPMVFTIQELEKKHLDVLKKIRELIEKVYKKFNILHRNFVSFASQGQLFCIRTKNPSDVFTYSSYSDKMVTLPYLIYSLGSEMVDNFWQRLEVEYSVKNFLVEGYERLYERKQNNITQSGQLTKIIDGRKESIINIPTPNPNPNHPKTQGRFLQSPQKNFGEYQISNPLYNATVLYIKTHPSKEVEIFFKASDGKFYYLKLIPILKRIDLFAVIDSFLKSKKKVFYKCGSDNMRTLDYQLPLYYFEEPIEITINKTGNEKEKMNGVNIFKNDFFTFPTITQNIKSFDQLNSIFETFFAEGISTEEKKLESYFSFTVYNHYKASIDNDAFLNDNDEINENRLGKDFMDIAKQNTECDKTICKEGKNETIYIFKKMRIEIDGVVYILIFKKMKIKGSSFRFIIWVFQTKKNETGNDIPIELHNNRARNIFYFNGSHLQKLLDIIRSRKKLFEGLDAETIDLTSYKNFYVNLISGITLECFHIQFIPFNLKNYASQIYGNNISYFTEERLQSCQNLVNIFKVDSKFFRKIVNNVDFTITNIPMHFSI